MAHRSILIADDDIRLLEALTVRLKVDGFDVITAQDAIQAVRFAREKTPDLLILDINMPAGDGFAVHERIREVPELREVPVIYLTGERSVRASYGAREMNAVAIVYKPFDTAHLMETVHAALGDGQRSTTRALDALQQAADDWSTGSSRPFPAGSPSPCRPQG